jgi:hypothetical protein
LGALVRAFALSGLSSTSTSLLNEDFGFVVGPFCLFCPPLRYSLRLFEEFPDREDSDLGLLAPGVLEPDLNALADGNGA